MAQSGLVKLQADVHVDEILAVLDRDGGVIISKLISQEKLDQIAHELKPHEQPDQIWKGNFFPEATKRICGAATKSQTYAEEILLNPVYQEICSRLLTIKKTSRYGEKVRTFVCKPIANASTVFDVGPGAEAQQLHRDDGVHHVVRPTRQPVDINILVAQTRTVPENGATVVIPGSHKWVCFGLLLPTPLGSGAATRIANLCYVHCSLIWKIAILCQKRQFLHVLNPAMR